MVLIYYVYHWTWLLCERNWYWKHEYDGTNMETTIKAVGMDHIGQDKLVLVLILFILDRYNGNKERVPYG